MQLKQIKNACFFAVVIPLKHQDIDSIAPRFIKYTLSATADVFIAINLITSKK